MRQYNLRVMLLQSGLYMMVGLITIVAMNLVVSGDSTIQRQSVTTRLSIPPSKVVR